MDRMLEHPIPTIPRVLATGKPQKSEVCPANFFRCTKWCPDGGRVLAQCEDRTLQMMELRPEAVDDTETLLNPDPAFLQSAPILDFTWYPGASVDDPSQYCFVASVRECPLKLLDAATGRLRASYRIVDHRERQVAPHSVAFNGYASHLYCGYEDAIEVFDLQRPGEGTKIRTTPSKKSRDGMKGIVSSIAFSPDYSGLYAASSLTSAIMLLSETTGEDPIAYLDGMTSAITQVKFSPTHPHLLFASQRRSNDILCWDVREPFEVLRRFKRTSSRTNQKLLFDIDPSGRWLATGDEDGNILLYDVTSEANEHTMSFHAHDDAVGSVAFSPQNSEIRLFSVSGSRNFESTATGVTPTSSQSLSHESGSDSEDGGSDSDSDSSTLSPLVRSVKITRSRNAIYPFAKDSTAKLWNFTPTRVGDMQADASG